MRWLLWVLPVRLFLWALVIFLMWQVLVLVRGKPEAPPPPVRHMLNEVATQSVAALQAYQAQNKRIGVVHFVNDSSGAVTDAFTRAFARPVAWTVDERSVIQRFLSDVGSALARATTPEEVAFAGRQVELDWVVMGRVKEATAIENVVRVDLVLWIYDLEKGAWLVREQLIRTRDYDAEPVRDRSFWSRPVVRIAIWCIIAALLPWLTAPLIYRAIEHKSNALSATLLGGYGIADLLLLLALTGFTVTGYKPALLIIVALSAAMIYNYRACEKIAEATK